MIQLVGVEPCIFNHRIEYRILIFQKFVGGVELSDDALVHDDDPVVVQDGVQPVGDGQHGAALELLADRTLNKLVSFLNKKKFET